MDDEQIIGVFISEIRSFWDNLAYRAYFTNYRIILADLKVSSGFMAFGPIGIIAMKKKADAEMKKLDTEIKSSLDNLLKKHKNNVEIRYDKIKNIEYKYGKKSEPPLLTIHYSEPLRKSKNQINLAFFPDQEYRKAKKAEGIKGGNVHIELGKDLLKIIQPFLGNKLITTVKR